MKKMCGMTRSVYIGENWVIKVTRAYFHPWTLPKYFLKKRDWSGLWRFMTNNRGGTEISSYIIVKDCLDIFLGFWVNWREFKLWRQTRDQIFTPTVFSVGFMSIQRKVQVCDCTDLAIELFENFCYDMRDRKDQYSVDRPHHFQNPANFGFLNGQLVMLDYGDSDIEHVVSTAAGRNIFRQHLSLIQAELLCKNTKHD